MLIIVNHSNQFLVFVVCDSPLLVHILDRGVFSFDSYAVLQKILKHCHVKIIAYNAEMRDTDSSAR
jgi:hypothetical protein